jgi:nitroreductase
MMRPALYSLQCNDTTAHPGTPISSRWHSFAQSNFISMKYNLSEISAVIRNRRSVVPENFTERKVHREQVELILNNGLWAPTHGMTQPWRFKVFMDVGRKKLMQFLPELYKSETDPSKFKQTKYERLTQRLQHVSVIVVICMERDKTGKIAEIEEVEAVACAVQNMMLTCTAYGLGSYWSSPSYIYKKAMNDFLRLDKDDKCLGIFYIGYPATDAPDSHRKPLEYVTEWIAD